VSGGSIPVTSATHLILASRIGGGLHVAVQVEAAVVVALDDFQDFGAVFKPNDAQLPDMVVADRRAGAIDEAESGCIRRQ
jgi:hypothetical protein